MQSFVLVVLALYISSASAAATGSSATLARRQAPNVPSIGQCESQCSAIENSANCIEQNSSDPTSCTCSTSFGNAIASCYSCAVSAGALDSNTAQEGLQGFITSCSEAGTPFSTPPTLSSSNSGGGGGKKSNAVITRMSTVSLAAALTGAIGIILLA